MSKREDQIATLLQSIDALAEARATLARAFTALQFTAGSLQELEAVEPPTLPAALLQKSGQIRGDLEELGYGQRWATIEVMATIEIEVEGQSIEIEKVVEVEIENVTDHVDHATVTVDLDQAIRLIASILSDSPHVAEGPIAHGHEMTREDVAAGITAFILAEMD